MKCIYTLIITFALSLVNDMIYAQGCVAIRGNSACGGNSQGFNQNKGDFQVGSNFRYFQSFRHFRGSHQERNRIEAGTQVINDSYFVDLTATYAISNRFFATTIIPFVYHERSSMYEHGGNPPNGLGERHKTYSKGLADVRLSAGYWVFDPETNHNHNLAFGLGVKVPTGNYHAKDIFYNQGEERNQDIEAVVDQSIQPGDGGLGLTLELQGYKMLSQQLLLSTNLYYLINPAATNGVLTRNGNSEFSVPDQYAIRFGASYILPEKGLSFYLGPRMEAVPSTDLIGSSEGYRRPGYVISIEPGIAYAKQNFIFNLNVPVAVERNRTKSYSDKITGRHGDAAFADYLISLSLSYRISKSGATVAPKDWNQLID